MRKIREIVRLKKQGLSHRQIAKICGVVHNIWFRHQSFATSLRVLNGSALFRPAFTSLVNWHAGELLLKISSPERAMLEYCFLLPKYADFEEARQLMQGLTTLRAQLLQSNRSD